jgi:hypothetical protein
MARAVASSCLIVLVVGLLAGCELVAAQLLAQFEFALQPPEVTIAAGSSETVRVAVMPVVGISLTAVTVRVTEPPAGITAAPLVVVTEADWRIDVAATVTPATYSLRVEAVSQGLNLLPVTRTRTLTLHVTP